MRRRLGVVLQAFGAAVIALARRPAPPPAPPAPPHYFSYHDEIRRRSTVAIVGPRKLLEAQGAIRGPDYEPTPAWARYRRTPPPPSVVNRGDEDE